MQTVQNIRLPKRFDYSASTEFNNALAQSLNVANGKKEIIVDCAELEYLDSAGIGLLVMAHKRVMNSQAHLVMINLRQSAKDILLLANLQRLIEFR